MMLSVNIHHATTEFGIVSKAGKISHEKKFETRDWTASAGITQHLIMELKKYVHTFPGIIQIGIGLPGLLSADRKTIVHVPFIPELDTVSIADLVQGEFPGMDIKFERSANCMAMGEFHFGNYSSDNFLLVHLDSYIDSAAIINGQVFKGAGGNGVQLASMLINGEQPLENELRWHHLEEYIYRKLDEEINEHSKLSNKGLYPELVYKTALQKDSVAQSVFIHAGYVLGNALVSVISLLDVSLVLLTGRLAIATDLLLPALKKQLNIHLSPYYTKKVSIQKARLGEKAGLLGAAYLFN